MKTSEEDMWMENNQSIWFGFNNLHVLMMTLYNGTKMKMSSVHECTRKKWLAFDPVVFLAGLTAG